MRSFNLNPVQYCGPKYMIHAVLLGSRKNGGTLSLIAAPKGLMNGDFITLESSGTGRPKIVRAVGCNEKELENDPSWLVKLSTRNRQEIGVGAIYIANCDRSKIDLLSYGVGRYATSGPNDESNGSDHQEDSQGHENSQGYIEVLLKVSPRDYYSIPIIVDNGTKTRGGIRVYIFSTTEVVFMTFETLIGLVDVEPLENQDAYQVLSIKNLPRIDLKADSQN